MRSSYHHTDRPVCVCWVIKLLLHGLGDAHVALGRLRGDTASGNQRLHWLVEEHTAGREMLLWVSTVENNSCCQTDDAFFYLMTKCKHQTF